MNTLIRRNATPVMMIAPTTAMNRFTSTMLAADQVGDLAAEVADHQPLRSGFPYFTSGLAMNTT